MYLDRERAGIDVVTALRVAQIEISRLKANESSRRAPAPMGEVSLVFTDVQDSTALWDADPDIMTEALNVHNRLMRLYIGRYNGYEVKTEGDAFMIAFSDPIDACMWCLDIQEALTLSEWPRLLLTNPSAAEEREDVSRRVIYCGLRVRMGIHVGTPLCSNDPNTGRMDYFGPDVNRSARVAGAAHGGQIIVSGGIFKLVENHLQDRLDDPIITPLGAHKMKGLRESTVLYQMLPRKLIGRTFNLPKTVTTSLEEMQQMREAQEKGYALTDDSVTEPPIGRVAIVISCIQGGRRFWEENPSDMGLAFHIHSKVLKAGVQKYNGYPVKSEGDKTLIAFSHIQLAIEFSMWVQVTLLEQDWPSAFDDFPRSARLHDQDGDVLFAGLRVAIGINYGEPICRENPSTGRMDYTGAVTNCCARVTTAASGGQVVVTNAVDVALQQVGSWDKLEIEVLCWVLLLLLLLVVVVVVAIVPLFIWRYYLGLNDTHTHTHTHAHIHTTHTTHTGDNH